MEKRYFHMFANGDDARNFIETEEEFKAAFNRFAVCHLLSGAAVLSFSVEDSHPHALLRGSTEACNRFKTLYEKMSVCSIARKRGSLGDVALHCELYEIDNEQYLMNVAAYTITQATKDGKAVMPYDYRFGTGALYFRSKYSILPWLVNEDGVIQLPLKFGMLRVRDQRIVCPTRKITIPDDWLVCNGFVLPENYVDIKGFESIFRTHNCFRAFLSSGKAKDDAIFEKMSETRGIYIEDLEARRLCSECCRRLYGRVTTQSLSPEERITLARYLRREYHISYRQLTFLTKVSESELRKYVR